MRLRLVLWAAVGLLALWVLTEVGLLLSGRTPTNPLYSSQGYWTVIVASAVVTVTGSWHHHRRSAWWWIAGGLLCWLAGDMIYELGRYGAMAEPPIPNISDLGYLLLYPAVSIGLVLLWETRAGTRRRRLLDGGAVALATAALVCAATLPLPLDATGLELLTLLSYPLSDALLLGVVISGLAMDEWRRNWSASALALGLGLFAVADVVFAQQSAAGSFTSPSLVDSGWMGGFVIVAMAALLPGAHQTRPDAASRRHTIMPTGFGALALGVVTAAPLLHLDASATIFAAGALALVLARLATTMRENAALIIQSSTEARTDQLTGLRNRRALLEDLTRVCQGSQAGGPNTTLALFDLNGFKNYNDTFGHPAGDDLLARLAKRLRLALPEARSYRLGGDEYCVLTTGDPVDELPLARAALREVGPGYLIDSAYGMARIPRDANDLESAMRVADLRMYEFKRSHRVIDANGLPSQTSVGPRRGGVD